MCEHWKFIRQELDAAYLNMDKESKLPALIGKDRIKARLKRSPDRADALALACIPPAEGVDRSRLRRWRNTGAGSGDTVSVFIPNFGKVSKGASFIEQGTPQNPSNATTLGSITDLKVTVDRVPVALEITKTGASYDSLEASLKLFTKESQVKEPRLSKLAQTINREVFQCVQGAAHSSIVGAIDFPALASAVAYVDDSRIGDETAVSNAYGEFTASQAAVPNTFYTADEAQGGLQFFCPLLAGCKYALGAVFASNAIAFASAAIRPAGGNTDSVSSTLDGELNIRTTVSFDSREGQDVWRVDTLYGMAPLYGAGAVALYGQV